MALSAAFVLLPSAIGAQPRNNYYRYTDDQGTLHITNVRNRPGVWKLWHSLPGSGGDQARYEPRPRPPVDLSGERLHRYDSIIRAAALRYQLPEPFVRAVIHTESNYDPHAVSYAGAMGLMQLMPSAATFLGVTKPFDPYQNVHGGTRYLRLLANKFNGDMVLVLAGYHAGAGAVRKYKGVPPYESTRAYVRAVLRRYYAYERQAQLGSAAARRGPARHIAG